MLHKLRINGTSRNFCILCRPDTIKAYDTEGGVMYWSSFTKTLVPGFRIGWCAAGRFTYEVGRIKSMHNGSNSNFSQRVVQPLLSSGTYVRHLQKFRLELNKNLIRTTELIEQHFPKGTKITGPTGGLVIWVELPEHINAASFQEKGFQQEVSYAPGELFSSREDYKYYIRISYCNLWENKVQESDGQIGRNFKSTCRKFRCSGLTYFYCLFNYRSGKKNTAVMMKLKTVMANLNVTGSSFLHNVYLK